MCSGGDCWCEHKIRGEVQHGGLTKQAKPGEIFRCAHACASRALPGDLALTGWQAQEDRGEWQLSNTI